MPAELDHVTAASPKGDGGDGRYDVGLGRGRVVGGAVDGPAATAAALIDAAAREVVGAAIVREDHVLAARRTTPPESAGRWELPGGKVEPGETSEAALVREIAEELGCAISVDGWLTGDSPIGDTHVLRVALASLTGRVPVAGADHDELRWLAHDQLGDVDWLEPDRPFLTELGERLREGRRGVLGSEA